MRTIPAVSIAIVLYTSACGPETSSDTSAGEPGSATAGASESTVVTPTEYVTSFHFLTTESGWTPALILQFSNTASPEGVDHSYRGWLLGRSGWRSILSAEFREPITRAPWRLFPSDSLRMVVTADGDPNELIFLARNASYTLDLGNYLDAWEDRAGTHHGIHAAQWKQGGRAISGIAVQHRFAIPNPQQPARFGPYEQALLRSEDDVVIVLFTSRRPEIYGNAFAWMYADGLTRRWTAVEARTVEVVNSRQLRRNIPIRFWFQIPEPDIKGELTAAARQLNEISTQEGPKPYNALYQVRGWVEFAGNRRRIEGLLERGEY